MKPLRNFDASLLANADKFTDPFYTRFTLRHAPQPLRLNDSVEKNYQFPTFYGDVTTAIGIFLCDYAKAKAVLPHPAMTPVRMPGGRAVVTISCYEYKQVMGVPPYNEVAVTIPVLVGAPADVPVLPLLWGGYPGMGYYVLHMPVTSQENQIRGRKIWGLPKVTEEIDIREQGGDCVTTCFDNLGGEYFKLRVPMAGKPTNFDVAAWIYSVKDGKLVRGRTNFKATFNVTKYMKLLWKKGLTPDRPYLEIADRGVGQTLRRLEIDPHPFQFRYAKPVCAAFDLPDPTFQK
jgi:hypothetical protein